LAGRVPLVSLGLDKTLVPPLPGASLITTPEVHRRSASRNNAHVLEIPTLHVHGTRDPGLKLHQQLFEEYCHPRTRHLVCWDGDHRVPLKRADVSVVAQQIRRLFEMTVSN
jgi:pimeloyl-ACP methyl ester carboxylesterase